MKLVEKELNRFRKQQLLPFMGRDGLIKLKDTAVLVVGLGGGGCAASLQLATSNVGKLILCDFDIVGESNLGRQFLHNESTIGIDKVVSAKIALKAINPFLDIETIAKPISEDILKELNNKYEMDVLNGETDENGALHFAPTVMTKDGTYNYILRQVSAPDAYEVTNITLIEITYKNGVITKISKQFNPNVNTEVCTDTENHVLITVGNDCVVTDPFDFQINLSDSADNSKIEGVTYLITTTNSNNQVRNEYVTTNVNGQINTKIYGTGNLNIRVTEQSPKVGYVADTTAKEMTVSRNNNIITVWYSTPGLNLQQSTSQEDMILNLTSTKKFCVKNRFSHARIVSART